MSVTDVPPSAERARPAARAHFVDLLRLFMSVQMIQGHAIDALLSVEARGGEWFGVWTWVRGLTAVGFLTAAGVSFHLSTLARWDAYRAKPEARARRVRRALMLIAIGYLLHAPAGALSGDAEVVRAAIDEALIVDVLQCIGVTMLVLEGLAALARRASHVVIASAVIAVITIGAAPWAATIDCGESGALRFACNYLSRSEGSLFPLLPWSGFIFAGVVAGAIAMPEGARTPGARTALRLGVASGVLVAGSMMLDALIARPAEPLLYSAAPAFSLVRLGSVLAIAALLAILSARSMSLPRAFRTLASETLFLYVSHLLVLYAGGIGLARVVGPTLPLGAAIVVAVALIVGCAVGALGWSRWKEHRRAAARAPT